MDQPFVPDPGVKPWERQPGESDREWWCFEMYRNMPNRSIARVAEQTKIPGPSLSTVARRWGWVYRTSELDQYHDQITEKQVEQAPLLAEYSELEQMLAVSRAMWKLAGIDLEIWHRKIQRHRMVVAAGGEVEPLLTPKDLALLVESGIKLQRLLQDKPGEIFENRVKEDADEFDRLFAGVIARGRAESRAAKAHAESEG
jgi:hypothetical protein